MSKIGAHWLSEYSGSDKLSAQENVGPVLEHRALFGIVRRGSAVGIGGGGQSPFWKKARSMLEHRAVFRRQLALERSNYSRGGD